MRSSYPTSSRPATRLPKTAGFGRATPLPSGDAGRSGCSLETLKDMTGGRGPDACIDAVGLEAHGTTLPALVDEVKFKMYLATDKPNALRQAIQACRKGGTVSIPGVYAGFLDKFPMGAAFAKAL